MNKFAFAVAAVGFALFAAPAAFASQAGGPDAQNHIAKPGVAADWAKTNVIWLAGQRQVRPTVSVTSLTGTASDPDDVAHMGRRTIDTGTASDTDDGVHLVRPTMKAPS